MPIALRPPHIDISVMRLTHQACATLPQVLRFANLVFEPLWNRQYIRNVQVGCSRLLMRVKRRSG